MPFAFDRMWKIKVSLVKPSLRADATHNHDRALDGAMVDFSPKPQHLDTKCLLSN